MDPYNPNHRTNFFRDVRASYRRMQSFRDVRYEMVKSAAGANYGSGYGYDSYVGGAEDKRRPDIVNLVQQALETYTMSLAAEQPRVLISTMNMENEWFARQFQVSCNELIKQIHLRDVLQRAAQDAYFCMGVAKVYLKESTAVEAEPNIWIVPGRPHVSNISLDDFVLDMSAKEWENIQYIGDQYRIPFDSLQDEAFDQEVVSQLQPTTRFPDSTERRVQQIGRGVETDPGEIDPQIDLVDIWLPRDNIVATFACDSRTPFQLHHKPLRVLDWDGDREGPYHVLCFQDVPDNVIPKGPCMDQHELHRVTNVLARKTVRQAMRQKTITTYEAGSEKDAHQVRDAMDGEMVKVNAVDRIREMTFGGADGPTQALSLAFMDWFDRQAGNLQTWAGLGATSDTAKQDAMVRETVSQKEGMMQQRMNTFTKNIVASVGQLMWDDELLEIPAYEEIDGTEYIEDRSWRPDDRAGGLSEYDFQIDPYSMSYQSPATRLRSLMTYVNQVFLPLIQSGVAPGVGIDVQTLTEMIAELDNLPRLKRIVTFDGMLLPENPLDEKEESGPTNTSREYVRRNESPGASPTAQSQIMQQLLQGQGGPQVNQQQINSMGGYGA